MATTQQMDYYSILGIPRTADDKAIKGAFRKLARKYHPDVNRGDSAAEEQFKRVNEAHEVLIDPASRKLYDRYGDQWRQYKEAGFTGDEPQGTPYGGPGAGAGWTSQGGTSTFRFEQGDDAGFADLFSSLFSNQTGFGPQSGQGFRRPSASRGESVEARVEISFEEAFSGTTRRLDLRTPEACAACGGSGFSGQSYCPSCGGQGVTVRNRTLEVKIPAGIADGGKVRIAGQGGPGFGGGPRGDVILHVTVHPDTRFTREGANLRTEVDVPLYTALLGGEIVVPTPTSRVALTVPVESQNGRVFRLRGQGMPTGKGDVRGDLYAKIRVVLPEHLTPREKELLAELRSLRSS